MSMLEKFFDFEVLICNPPSKKVIIFQSKWGCLNDGFHPVPEQEHLFQNLRHRLLASQILHETMSKIQRPGTKGKNIRKFIMKKWSMLENGTLAILNESDGEELGFEICVECKVHLPANLS